VITHVGEEKLALSWKYLWVVERKNSILKVFVEVYYEV